MVESMLGVVPVKGIPHVRGPGPSVIAQSKYRSILVIPPANHKGCWIIVSPTTKLTSLVVNIAF
jgi:hypothetical protein